jgi:hypothetical protein
MKASRTLKFVIVSVLAFVAVFASHATASADRLPFTNPGDKFYVPGHGCYMLLYWPDTQSRVSIQAKIPPWMAWVGDTCDPASLSSVRGYAFLDKNANGKWDAGESIFGEAWYKVTDGGSWYTCGYVGTDASYGVPVNSGTYYVMPVAPKGFKTTTPRIEVTVGTDAALNTNIGFVADPKATGDACDQYNPAR